MSQRTSLISRRTRQKPSKLSMSSSSATQSFSTACLITGQIARLSHCSRLSAGFIWSLSLRLSKPRNPKKCLQSNFDSPNFICANHADSRALRCCPRVLLRHAIDSAESNGVRLPGMSRTASCAASLRSPGSKASGLFSAAIVSWSQLVGIEISVGAHGRSRY